MENNEITYESTLVKNFIQDLREGKSFLLDSNKEPFYVVNYRTNRIYRDINFLIVGQAVKNQNLDTCFVFSQSQIADCNGIIEKGTKRLCTALYDNYNAYYKNNDMDVYVGLKEVGMRKKDKDGNYISPFIFSPLYDASSVYKSVFVPETDENGEKLVWEDDVIAKKNGVELFYKNGFTIKKKDGSEIKVNKGDPVILHKKGSIKGSYQKGEKYFNPHGYARGKAFNESKALPLYKRQNDSGEEILCEKLCEAFRGKLLGNYEGLSINKEEIDKIEEEYIHHPRRFRNAVRNAFIRARGDKEEVLLMEEKLLEKKEKEEERKNAYFVPFREQKEEYSR